MSRAAPLLALCVAGLLPAPALSSEADVFAGKVPPISGQLHRKEGRFELTPVAELSLNDAFFQKFLFGAKATWHFKEWLSATAAFSGGFASPTSSAQVCPPNQGCSPAFSDQLAAVPGEIKWKAGLEAGFAPVYAKMNLLAETVVHFDLSVLAGADYIAYREILPPPVNPGSPVSPGTDGSFGGHLGLGTRIFISDWGAIRVEFKDYLYGASVNGTMRLQQQLFLEAGLSIFMPFGAR